MKKHQLYASLVITILASGLYIAAAHAITNPLPSKNRLMASGLPEDTTQEEYNFFTSGPVTKEQREKNRKIITDYRAEKNKTR